MRRRAASTPSWDGLVPSDLAGPALLDAVAYYATRNATWSVRRVLSTWRRFARHLVSSGLLASDPVDGLIVPERPEWVLKALEYAEPKRTAQAAGSTDPRARDPWPERDAALFAVFPGAGVRSGEAIAMGRRGSCAGS